MSDMHRGAHFCPLEEDACQLIRSSVAAILALLKALLIVFRQAVQRMAAAGGGKDEESFTNDANGALCYERLDGHVALAALPALLTRNAARVSRWAANGRHARRGERVAWAEV